MKSFKTRGVVAIALVTGLGIVTPAVAFGGTTTTTTAPGTTTTVKATVTNPWKQWRHAQEAYVDQLEVIRQTFHSTVKTARDAFRDAVRASKGSANRAAFIAAARAALTLSIANAMGARSTALIALGNPPTPPAGTPRSAYIVALQGISETYRTAVASAQATFAVDFSTASTRAQRATVRAALELATANAAVARAAALTALGPPPVKNSATTTTTVPVTTTTL